MAVQGLNHSRSINTDIPSSMPEQAPELVEAVPERSESRSFGEHVLRYKRNMEAIEQISNTRNAEVSSAIDKLDQATQKLMRSNAKFAKSPYQPSPTLFGRHHHGH